MKILVTGGAGFVARHLTAELSSAGYEVWLSDCLNGEFSNYLKADLTDVESIYDLVTSVRPEAVVHLGAVSFVPDRPCCLCPGKFRNLSFFCRACCRLSKRRLLFRADRRLRHHGRYGRAGLRHYDHRDDPRLGR